MRHGHGIAKLGRTGSHRRATMRNLAIALFQHERIITTAAKAKALRSYAERLIGLAKRGDLHARRLAARQIHDKAVLQRLFSDIGPRFAERPGGYTRVLKMGNRRGDNAPQALIELVDRAVEAPQKEAEAEAPEASEAPADE